MKLKHMNGHAERKKEREFVAPQQPCWKRLCNYLLNNGVSNNTWRQSLCKALYFLDIKWPAKVLNQLGLSSRWSRGCCVVHWPDLTLLALTLGKLVLTRHKVSWEVKSKYPISSVPLATSLQWVVHCASSLPQWPEASCRGHRLLDVCKSKRV